MGYPLKSVTVGGHSLNIHGLAEQDPYFQSITDDLDPEFSMLLDLAVPKNAVCVDIGANIGIKSLQMAHHVPDGRVLAIEAAPNVFRVLEANIAASGLLNLIAEHVAMSDRAGTVKFADASAYGHISEEGVTVNSTTLPEFCNRHNLTKVDFVKIDVEGFEFPILRKAIDLFRQMDTVICLEFNVWCQLAYTNERPRECLEWLLSNFAEVHALRRDHAPEMLQRIMPSDALGLLSRNMFEDKFVTDLVAVTSAGRLDRRHEVAASGSGETRGGWRKIARRMGLGQLARAS